MADETPWTSQAYHRAARLKADGAAIYVCAFARRLEKLVRVQQEALLWQHGHLGYSAGCPICEALRAFAELDKELS